MTKKTIGSAIRTAIAEGKDTAAILALVKQEFPSARTTSASVSWYRSQMKKSGTPAPKAEKTSAPKAKKTTAAVANTVEGIPAGELSYEVRGLKSITGTEGAGYECTLYRGGKKVAVAVDHADGAPVHFYWADQGKATAMVSCFRYSAEEKKDVLTKYQGTYEEALFAAHALAKGTYKSEYDGEDRNYDMEIVIEEMVNDAILEKELDKLTKKGTRIAFVTGDGRLMTCGAAPTEENIKKYVHAHNATVINGMDRAEAVKLLKSLQR